MNLVAILAASIVSMVVGFLWYSPMLFGKPWMKVMGLSDSKLEEMKKKGMNQTYLFSFVGVVVMAYVLGQFLGTGGALGNKSAGIMVAFWVWLGFVAPVQMTDVLFAQRPWKLFFINTGYQLVSLMVMGEVLSSFG